MGRTNPTYRDQLRALERDWKGYRRGLRADEQSHFDRLFEQSRAYAHAASYYNPTTPEYALFLTLLLAHERRLAALEQEINCDEKGARKDDAIQD